MQYFRVSILSLFSAVALTLSAFALDAGSTSAASMVARQSFPLESGRFRAELVYVANYTANSVTAYPATAAGNVRPVITLAGPHTLLGNPIAIASDPQGRLFVACQHGDYGEILVFARGASGDTAPIRSFRVSVYYDGGTPHGPYIPTSIAVDSSGQTYVGLVSGVFGNLGVVGVFAPAAQGAARPLRVFFVAGNQSAPQIAVNDAGQVYVIQPWDRLNWPNLAEFSAFAAGNSVIRAVGDMVNDFLEAPGVAVAPRSGDLYAIDYDVRGNKVIIVFSPQFTNVIRRIGLGNNQFFRGIAVDGAGQVYIGTRGGAVPNSIEIFSAATSGNAAPSRIIAGPNTDLSDPVAITLIDWAPLGGRR